MLHRYRSLLDRMDTDLPLIVPLAFGTLAFFAAARLWNGWSPVLMWPLLVVSVALTLATGVPRIVRSYRAPDRAPIDWNSRLWAIAAIFIGIFVIGGAKDIVDGEPEPPLWWSVVVFVVGCLLLALIVRHVRKPIRPPEPRRPDRDDWDDQKPNG